MRARARHARFKGKMHLVNQTNLYITVLFLFLFLLKHYVSRVDTLEFLFEFWPFILTTRRQIEKGRGGDGNKSEQV